MTRTACGEPDRSSRPVTSTTWAVAPSTGGVDRRGPRPGRHQSDRDPDVVVDPEADRVLQPGLGLVIEERVGKAGAIGADKDPLAQRGVWQLRQGQAEQADVVEGGVGPRRCPGAGPRPG